jgi:hypothetical protein
MDDFSEVEAKAVREFFKSTAGRKVLASLDNRAQAKNNLLEVVNLVGDKMDFQKVGTRCALHAIETQMIMEIKEFLESVGDEYVNQD